MTRRPAALVAAALAAALTVTLSLGLAARPAGAAAGRPAVERALIISLPALTWEMVAEQRPPALLALLDRSAVASTSVRTLGARTDAGEGYVTIGSGNRASAERAFAGLAFDRDAIYEEGDVAAVFERRAGVRATGQVFHLGIARVIDLNERFLYGADPGSLGASLAAAGRSAAVVANADGAVPGDQNALHREAALAVMDAYGRVAGGTVGTELVAQDPRFPFGLRMDLQAARAAFDEAWGEHDLVLLEASDLYRADRYSAFATAEAEDQARRLALAAADDLVAHALAAVDLDRQLVVVVAPTSTAARTELAVGAVAGPGFEAGLARSASTRRDGYLTLPDVGPTVLDAFGVDVPSEMTGGLIRSAGGGTSLEDRMAQLVEQNERAVFRDRAVWPISISFIALQGLAYALAAVALTVRRPSLRPWARGLALVTLAIPPLTYLSGLGRYDRLGQAGYLAATLGAAGLLAGAASLAERRVGHRAGPVRPAVAPLLLVALTLAVLLADVATGGSLQINTVFGYSPIVAGRFAGYGNQAFALLAVTAVLAASGAWAVWREGAGHRVGALGVAATALFFAGVVVADGHPALGADVGGVLALVPASVVVMVVLTGARLTVRRAMAVAGSAVAAVAVFALVDLSRPADARTHLGRFVSSGTDGDLDAIGTVIVRKATSNINVLLSSAWSWAIPLTLAFLAFLTWRESGFLRPLLRRVPALRAGLAGVLVAAALGFAVNDSGVAVPTMMLGVLLPYLAAVVVHPAASDLDPRP